MPSEDQVHQAEVPAGMAEKLRQQIPESPGFEPSPYLKAAKQAESDQQGRYREIDNLFTYHRPTGSQTRRYELLRRKGRELAYLIEDAVPNLCDEKHLAIERLREAVMWANAGIACNEDPA